MPDLDTELARFGQWLDAQIDAEVVREPGAAALAGMPDRLGRRRSARLTTLVLGVAAVILAGLIGLANRRPTSPAGPPPSGEPTSAAAPNSAVSATQSVTSTAENESAATTTALDRSALGTAPTGTTRSGNRPPVASDDVATTTVDTAVHIDVLANDTDPDGQTLRVVAIGRSDADTRSIGGLEPGSNGVVITFTPAKGFLGRTSFTYTIEDTAGGTATATVEVTVVAPRSAALHLLPSDTTGLTMPGSIERGELTLGPAVLVGRPSGSNDFTDVWWIDVGGQRPLPFDLDGPHPEGRSGGGSTAWINEHGTLVRLEAAPHTEVSSPPCPQGAVLCVFAGSTLDQLLQRIVIDDTGQVTWTLPDGMIEIARTTREITSEPTVWTGEGLSIIVDDQAVLTDFIAARPHDLKRVRVRGHDGWLVVSYPFGPDGRRYAGVEWEERPGVVASVSGVASDERLLAAAEDLRVATDNEWAALVASARAGESGGYVVVTDDTLRRIASKLGVTLDELLAANPELDPTKFLLVGQTIKVPTR